MTFDEKISLDVSLSKILDEFLETKEHPGTILNFLDMYPNEITDIFKMSDLYQRIFALDFIKECSIEQCKRFVNIFIRINSNFWTETMYLSWQVLRSNIGEDYKNIFRNITQNNMRRNVSHPYKRCSIIISEFDELFCNVNDSIYTIIANINNIPNNIFSHVLNNITSSLWVNRLYQLDIFSGLDTVKQYLMLDAYKKIGCSYKFIKQVL
jgi:hypothetical protein